MHAEVKRSRFMVSISLVSKAFECILDGRAEPIDDQIDIACGRNIGRREKHVISAVTVDGPTRRIACQAKVKGRLLDSLMQIKVGIEWSSACSVFNQLDRLEETAASYVANVPMVAKPLGQFPFQHLAQRSDLLKEPLLLDDPLHFERRRTCHRVGKIGVAVLERSCAIAQCVDDRGRYQHCTNWLKAAAKTLSDGLDVWRHS